MRFTSPKTIRDYRKLLVADSIERKRWMDKLITLVRAEERERVLGITNKTRERSEQ